MNNNRRIYSRNMAAYILATTQLTPNYGVDEENGKVYFQFPPCAAVEMACVRYKGGNPVIRLQDFLRSFEYIKNKIYSIKHSEVDDGIPTV